MGTGLWTRARYRALSVAAGYLAGVCEREQCREGARILRAPAAA